MLHSIEYIDKLYIQEYRQTLDEGRPSAQRRKIERKQGQNGPLKKDGHDKSKKKTKRTVASNIISDMGTPKVYIL